MTLSSGLEDQTENFQSPKPTRQVTAMPEDVRALSAGHRLLSRLDRATAAKVAKYLYEHYSGDADHGKQSLAETLQRQFGPLKGQTA